MKIAVISDIHDNLANLERFLKLAEELKIEGIICCGDVTTPETLEKLVSDFSGPIKLACGNMEIRREEFAEVAERHKNLEVFAEL
ncbi:MAG: metallophosphoesterase family protein, partial [Candidatus Paceibacterota bacterium]